MRNPWLRPLSIGTPAAEPITRDEAHLFLDALIACALSCHAYQQAGGAATLPPMVKLHFDVVWNDCERLRFKLVERLTHGTRAAQLHHEPAQEVA